MKNGMVGVGIIGLGFGRSHLKGYLESPDAKVLAVCARTEASARRLADEFGIDVWETDYRRLIELPEMEAVSICAPVHLHHEMASAAISAGKHVLCEKPLSMNAASCQSMLKAAEKARIVNMTNFGWRFSDAAYHIKTLVDDGWLGELFHINARYMMAYRADPSVPFGWRDLRDEGGMGALGDLGVHLIDMVRWWVGEFEEVFACSHSPISQRRDADTGELRTSELEDTCGFLSRLACGAQGVFHVSRSALGSNYMRIELHGSGGALTFDFDRESMQARVSGSRTGRTRQEMLTPESRSPASAQQHFVSGITEGRMVEPGFFDGWRVQQVADALVASDCRRDWVTVARE